jgi:hypothetical protein
MLLSLSCYKLACHLFPTLAEYFMYSHLPYFFYIAAMLCCSEDEEFFDEDFFYACGPPVIYLWHGILFLLLRPLSLVIGFILRLDVINTGYIVYFTICRFMCET